MRCLFVSNPENPSAHVHDFINLFNRLTNILISSILEASSESTRLKAVRFTLKMARMFYQLGSINGFKACLAALQSNSIHRLKLIDQLGQKYSRRFVEMEEFASPDNNFDRMRCRRCLIPWLGLLLRDFSFVREAKSVMSNAEFVHLPFACSLQRIVNSMAHSSAACFKLLKDNAEFWSLAGAAKDWLLAVPIDFENEEVQFQRSLQIQS